MIEIHRWLPTSKAKDPIDARRRRLLGMAALAPLALRVSACGGGGSSTPLAPATRSYAMGFYPNPPQASIQSVLDTVDQMSRHGEFMHIHEELPWTDLLNGQSADDAVNAKAPLVTHARSKGLRFGYFADLTDGLDRSQQPPQLRALNRSITEPQVQRVYRDYVAAVARQLQPDYIGLTAETNLVRLQAPPSVYAAMVAEGGWSSASAADFDSSPDLQRRYIVKQGELLDSIDATPALDAWDALRARTKV